MATPRFYCAALDPGVVELDKEESAHALGSRRLRVGEEAILFDGRGRLAHATLLLGSGKAKRRRSGEFPRARFEVQRVLCEPPPRCRLTLIVAGCKGPRLTWMVEKLTELGTTTIVVANFERSVVRVGARHAERLRRTALQASKQSQRAWFPEIACGADLADAVREHAGEMLLVAHPGEDSIALPAALHRAGAQRTLAAVVGPEGGLTDGELAQLRQRAGLEVRLATTILRVETAAVAIAANWAAHHWRVQEA